MSDIGIFWTARFDTTAGVSGTGIIVFNDGNLYGGDKRHYCFGKCKTPPNQSLKADLTIVYYYSPRDRAFGDEERYSLKFKGKYSEKFAEAEGYLNEGSL